MKHKPNSIIAACVALFAFSSSVAAATNVYRMVLPDLQVTPAQGASQPSGTASQPSGAASQPSGPVNPPPPAVQAGLQVSPPALAFGSVDRGQNAQKILTLTNPGDLPLVLSSPVASGAGFNVVNDSCSASLPGRGSCNLVVTYSPQVTGPVSGQISLSGNSGAASAVVPLSGSGNAGTLSFTPAELSFGDQTLDTSRTLQLRVTNTSASNPVQVQGIDVDPRTHFNQNNNCGAELPAGASCDVSVMFTPGVLDGLQATGYVTSDAANAAPVGNGLGAQFLPISGRGVGSVATLTSAAAIQLPPATYGVASQGKWTFRNDGNVPMSLVAPTMPAPFTVSNGCTQVAPGASCDMVVEANTTQLGTFEATNLAVSGATRGNRSNLSAQVGVSGSVVSLKSSTASSLVANKGAAAASGLVTFQNTGNAPVTLSFSGISSPYSLDKASCELPARTGVNNGECSVTVSMATSGTRGAQPDQTLVATGASSGALSVPVSGRIDEAYGALTATTNLAFGDVPLGTSAERTVTFRNEGNAPAKSTFLVIWGVNYQMQLKAGSTCGIQSAPVWVQPGESCTATLVYTPDARGSLDAGAELRMTTSAQGGPFVLPISGRGVAAAPALTAQTNTAFGTRVIGTTDTRSFTLRNDGNIALPRVAARVEGTDLRLSSNSCGTGSSPLAAGGSCNLVVEWAPKQVGVLANARVVVSSDGQDVGSLALTGTGAPVAALATAGSLVFGDVAVGSQRTATLTVTNPAGNPTVAMNGIVSSDPALTYTTTCGQTLAADSSCSIQATYQPTTVGQKTLALTVTYNGSTQAVFSGSSTDYAQLTKVNGAYLYTDGTAAPSCKAYMQTTTSYRYGNAGDGDYMLQISAGKRQQVYCDMSSDGGGWAMVAKQYETSPVNWAGGTNGNSFALDSTSIPNHTQMALGKDLKATIVDYFDIKYSTGDIPVTVVASKRFPGTSYQLSRIANGYYPYHDPERGALASAAAWNNTLSLDKVGGTSAGFNWAFSPNHPDSKVRGYSMLGALQETSTETYAWTVWVR